jgi:hypothetical protein
MPLIPDPLSIVEANRVIGGKNLVDVALERVDSVSGGV